MDDERRLYHKTKTEPQTEKEAFNLANAGRIFPYDVPLGEISKDEMRAIAQYPVTTDYKTYLIMRNMSREQLRDLLPYGKDFFDDLDQASLFRYLTRGILLDRPGMKGLVNRLARYSMAHNFTRDIILTLYGSLKVYARASNISPIEGPIFAYDEILGTPLALTMGSLQLGISAYSDEELINRLMDYIEKNRSKTEKAVGMTVAEFESSGLPGNYQNRTDTIMSMPNNQQQ